MLMFVNVPFHVAHNYPFFFILVQYRFIFPWHNSWLYEGVLVTSTLFVLMSAR